MGTIEVILGRRFKENRERLELSQQDIADAADCSKEVVYKFEAGKTKPNSPTLDKMLKKVGLDAHSFIHSNKAELEEIDKSRLLLSIIPRLDGLENDELEFISFVIDKLPVLETLDLAGAKALISQLLDGKNKKKT